MERDLDEMLVSQEKMLARLSKPAAPRAAIERSFTEHLRKLREWLADTAKHRRPLRPLQRASRTTRRTGEARQCISRRPAGCCKNGRDGGFIALPQSENADRPLEQTACR